MVTEVLSVDTCSAPTQDQMATVPAVLKAVAMLHGGLPVALPTETVYGLAADALNAEAVLKIFSAKQRPSFDPLIVHLPFARNLEKVARVPAEDAQLVEALIARFWPGPLTILLPKQEVVPDVATAGLPGVAVRISAHPVFRAVVEAFGGPLAAPSANRFGRISPTTGAHVLEELGGRIPLVLDAGTTLHGLESTIVRIDRGSIRILRAGPICAELLSEFAPVQQSTGNDALPEVPGRLASHYAPATPLFLRDQKLPAGNVALLAWRESSSDFATCEVLSAQGDLLEAAATLFAKLRKLDASGVNAIVADLVPETGLGVAINDRLRRAAARKESL